MQNSARSIAYVVATLWLATLPICANSSPGGDASADPPFRLLGFDGEGIAALVMDPTDHSTLFATTQDNRVFKSADAGEHWTLAANVVADTVAIDPTNSKTVYASECRSGGKTYKSEDGGDTWRVISDASDLLSYHGLTLIVVDPSAPSVLYGVTPATLLKSTDGGQSWNRIRSSDSGFSYLVIHPTDSSTLLLGDHNADVVQSTDGGASWRILGVIYPEPYDVRPLVMDPANPQVLYARVADSVFKSTSGGQKWNEIVEGLPISDSAYAAYTSLAIDPGNSSVIYVGMKDGVYRSSNGGENWLKLAEVPSVSHIVVDPKDPSTLYAGGRGVWVIHQD